MATKSAPRTQKRLQSRGAATLDREYEIDLAQTEAEASLQAQATHAKPRFSFGTFDSLADRNFRWYFFSMFGWFASMNMQMLVRGYIVFDLTGSYAALGIVSLANATPGLLLALPGGVLADRMSKKVVIQVGQVANMAVALVLGLLMLAGVLIFEHLLVGAVLQGTINALIMPARQSMIPEIVSEARLMNAVALNTAGVNTMRLVAPAVGGLMLAIIGPGWVYMTMATLYLLGALFLFKVPVHAPAQRVVAMDGGRPGKHGRAKITGLSDIAEGCRYMWRDRTVLTILVINLLIVVFSMPYQMMLPGFVKEVLDAGPGRLGLLMSITGVGSLIGSLIIASLPARRRGLLLLSGALFMGVCLVLFSFSTWFWITAVIMLGVGLGQSTRMSLGNVLLQSYTQAEYRGRVMSIYMMEFSLVSFGTFVIGVLSNVLGVQTALGATSVLLVVFVAASFVLSPRMRRLQ